jgi:hypothetical protein
MHIHELRYGLTQAIKKPTSRDERYHHILACPGLLVPVRVRGSLWKKFPGIFFLGNFFNSNLFSSPYFTVYGFMR